MVIEKRPRLSSPSALPDLTSAAEAVSEKVMMAAYDASLALTNLGIHHALIGGIAVGAHGAPRATKDVDFLVAQRDAFVGTAILSFKPGVPIAIREIAVDYLTPEGNAHCDLLQQGLGAAIVSHGVPVLPLEALIVMKLQAGRRHDLHDVERLLARLSKEDLIRDYLTKYAPELLPELDTALRHR